MTDQKSLTSRWCGYTLLLACVGYVVSVFLYLGVYGQPVGSGTDGTVLQADRVEHLQANWPLAQSMWSIEMTAVILLAIAGLLFLARAIQSRRSGIDVFVWATVAVGAIFLLPMYPMMLAGYPEGVRVFDEHPGLIASINSIVTLIFSVGNAVLYAGLGGAVYVESNSSPLVQRAVGLAAAGLGVIGFIGMLSQPLGLDFLQPLAVGGVIVVGLSGYMGIRMIRDE